MRIGDYDVFLEFDSGETSLEDEGPSRFLYPVTGEVVAVSKEQRRWLAGRFSLYYVNVVAAVTAGASVAAVFESDVATSDYYRAMFSRGTPKASPRLQRVFDTKVRFGNVLIMDRIEILPRFRSHNLGLHVMRRLFERFGTGVEMIAIKPFPLQSEDARLSGEKWRGRMKLATLEPDLRRATAKLRRHYKKLGFRAMKGTPFMFLRGQEPLPNPTRRIN
jgi:hypothetical protein